MADYNGVILTNKGEALLSKALSGTALEFTKVQFGNGYIPDEVFAKNMTSLISPKSESVLYSVSRDDVNTNIVHLKVILSNYSISEEFQIKEIGIFANDPDEGEILYGVLYSYTPDTFPTTDVTKVEEILDIRMNVQTAPNIVLNINNENSLLPKEDVDNLADKYKCLNKPNKPTIDNYYNIRCTASYVREHYIPNSELYYDYQISDNSAFSNIIEEKTDIRLSGIMYLSAGNYAKNLSSNSIYYIRFRIKSDNHISEWSDYLQFNTPTYLVESIDLYTDDFIDRNSCDINAWIYMTDYKVYLDDDEHLYTSWTITDEDGFTVWSSYYDYNNLKSIKLPADVLEYGKTYTINAVAYGYKYNVGPASLTVTIKEGSKYPSREIASLQQTSHIGTDYYGKNVAVSGDGTLIVSGSKDTGAYGSVWWTEYNRNTGVFYNETIKQGVSGNIIGVDVTVDYTGSVVATTGRDSGTMVYHTHRHQETPNQEFKLDYSSQSVSLSHNGTILATGKRTSDALVIYNYANGSWHHFQSIASYLDNGGASVPFGEHFGETVSISGNGLVIAVGECIDDDSVGAISIPGKVHIFRYDSNTDSYVYMQSETITRNINGDNFGVSISLDYDGNRIVIKDSNDTIYLYEYNGTSWSSIFSSTLPLNLPRPRIGYKRQVDISGDGTKISAVYYEVSGNTYYGAFFVEENGSWTLAEKLTPLELTSGVPFDTFSTAMNSDGTIVALGYNYSNSNDRIAIFE